MEFVPTYLLFANLLTLFQSGGRLCPLHATSETRMICKLKKLDRSALFVVNSIHPSVSKLADNVGIFSIITEPERGAKLQDTNFFMKKRL